MSTTLKPAVDPVAKSPPSLDVIRKLVEDEDDFGHELRVGNIVNNVRPFTGVYQGIHLEHGGTYTDSVTGKSRQFDYRATFEVAHSAIPPFFQSVIHLAIECKNLSSDAPLVVCGQPRTANEAFVDNIRTDASEIVLDRMRSARVLRYDGWPTLYQPGEFVGKSLVRIRPVEKGGRPNGYKVDPDADVYDKWSQALSSAVDLVEKAYCSKETTSAILPVVVVPDGRLMRVKYDDSGKIAEGPLLVDEAQFYVGRIIDVRARVSRSDFTCSHIHFLTLNGFLNFIRRIADRDLDLNRIFHQVFRNP